MALDSRRQTMDKIARIPGIVNVYGDLYAKTPESLRSLIQVLKESGYNVKDLREDKSTLRNGPINVEAVRSLWFAHLDETTLQRKGVCCSCNELISTSGIETHGHACENCGAVTYLKFQNGARVRFQFAEDESFFNDLTLIVHSYDQEKGEINFYSNKEDFKQGEDASSSVERSYSRLNEQLSKFPKAFTRKNIDGIEVISIPYNDEDAKIHIFDISGQVYNFKIVKVFRGEIFKEWDPLPVPEMLSIYESWHWAPLKPSPVLHEKILHAASLVSRVDYYYQDGRTAVYSSHIEAMRLFVENFTTLDINAWDRMIQRAPGDGPGMIRAIAAFCHPNPIIEDNPNIGNFLVGMSKILSGQGLTPDEVDATKKALEDPRMQDFLKGRKRK